MSEHFNEEDRTVNDTKAPYQSPELKVYGTLRDLTAGTHGNGSDHNIGSNSTKN